MAARLTLDSTRLLRPILLDVMPWSSIMSELLSHRLQIQSNRESKSRVLRGIIPSFTRLFSALSTKPIKHRPCSSSGRRCGNQCFGLNFKFGREIIVIRTQGDCDPSTQAIMATLASRSTKRLRLSYGSTQWVCKSCTRRAFISSLRTQQQAQQSSREDEKTTHFGFQTVAEGLKESKVGEVFSSVASNYDTMNDLMSMGVHRLWKDYFVRNLNPGIPSSSLRRDGETQRVLDVAGGTGDIALRILDHATVVNRDSKLHVTVSDINASMLSEGRKRLSSSPYMAEGRVDFLEANAENLDAVEDNSIDLYTVAFGIRNMTHKDQALREAYRVLKPGGVFACLEFTPQLSNPLLNAVYKRWSFGAIPLIGQVVAGDRDSYQYLVESIEKFPSQREFEGMIKEAGFLVPGQASEEGRERQGWVDLSPGGVAAVHKGVKPV